jgi:hypothetical protein
MIMGSSSQKVFTYKRRIASRAANPIERRLVYRMIAPFMPTGSLFLGGAACRLAGFSFGPTTRPRRDCLPRATYQRFDAHCPEPGPVTFHGTGVPGVAMNG